jgi:prophage antirepressor-like protein
VTAVDLFNYDDHVVRVVVRDSAPWWVAADVLGVLGLNRSSLVTLDSDEKGVHSVYTLGGDQDMTLISEPGLYSLILRSRKPEAKAFKRWITHEVLPSIRRTGGYGVPAPRPAEVSRRDLALMVLEAEDARAAAEAKVAALEPRARAADTLVIADGDVTLREAAQILSRDPAISMGQNRLSKYLKQIGWISQDQRPYQRHVDAGRLKMRLVEWEHPDYGPQVTPKTVITPKGLMELHRLLAGA